VSISSAASPAMALRQLSTVVEYYRSGEMRQVR
jgi:hypothetical protein